MRVLDINGKPLDITDGWFPEHVVQDENGKINIQLALLANRELQRSFTTLDLEKTEHRRSVTLDQFPNIVDQPLDRLAGLIFHTGRTGSTMAANMLKASGKTHVIAESKAIGEALSFIYIMTPQQADHILYTVIKLFSTAFKPSPQKIVLKFSSWHVLHCDALYRVLSGIPSIFIWRDPVEVISAVLGDTPDWLNRSLIRRRVREKATELQPVYRKHVGYVIRNQSDYFDDTKKYTEFVCDCIKGLLLTGANQKNIDLVVHYPQIYRQMIDQVFPLFNIELTKSEISNIDKTISYSAKSEHSALYKPDDAKKRWEAPPFVHSFVENELASIIKKLNNFSIKT